MSDLLLSERLSICTVSSSDIDGSLDTSFSSPPTGTPLPTHHTPQFAGNPALDYQENNLTKAVTGILCSHGKGTEGALMLCPVPVWMVGVFLLAERGNLD